MMDLIEYINNIQEMLETAVVSDECVLDRERMQRYKKTYKQFCEQYHLTPNEWTLNS